MDHAARDIVRFAASKVAAVVGLHEFGDPVEDFLEYLYQDRDELLLTDAQKLHLEIVSKDAELDALMAKTGAALAPQLRAILAWTADRKAPPAQLSAARALLASVDSLLATAQQTRALGAEDAQETKRLLAQRIHQSVGVRNERLALQSYERQQGCDVRLANEHLYFLKFPPPPPSLSLLPSDSSDSSNSLEHGSGDSDDVFAELDAQTQRVVVPKRAGRRGCSTQADSASSTDDANGSNDAGAATPSYFSVCGMVDGVADVLAISADDDWSLAAVVVEVKNRMRAFRDPLPLHDHIQMAVYMKMLALTEGDLVQCLNTDTARIQVTRISLHTHPLRISSSGDDLWTRVVLPRLYRYAAALQRLRANELLRLAFLNGSAQQRLEMLRRECDFL